MNEVENQKIGQSTITYKLRLYEKHLDWLEKTKVLYNQVLEFYYQILLGEEALLEMSNHLLLRELEVRTVGTKEMRARGEKPLYLMDSFPTLPLYFRRAAINNAISLMRGYLKNRKNWEEEEEKTMPPSPARSFRASPVYYKGMYREFSRSSVELKVFNGKKWVWILYRFHGREIPEGCKTLSPTIKWNGKEAWLHVPVVQDVFDIRTVRQRMECAEVIAAVYLPGSNNMAVCVILDRKGQCLDSCFVKGGVKLQAQRQKLCKKAEKSLRSRHPNGDWKESSWENRVFYEKIERLNDHYAHVVSRRIVNYCLEQKVTVIAVPNYESGMNPADKPYFKTTGYEWIGRKIISFLKYKAFQSGIVVSGIPPYHIADRCSQCGAEIKRYNERHVPNYNYLGGQLYRCSNGHQGNSALNAAKNVGLHFLGYYN